MDAAAESGSSVVGLRVTMTVFPILGLIAALVLFRRKFILTEEKMTEITVELKTKK